MDKYMKNLLIIFSVFVFASCSTVKYENSININAPADTVFSILENYENYPHIIPEFHANVKVISEDHTGLGVKFINNSIFGGYRIESIYEITEYIINEYIKMENKSQYGSTEMIVETIGENETKYTLINNIRIPASMKNKLYNAFNNELETIKEVCEKNDVFETIEYSNN
jgi:uncharacterized membrane protein